MAKTKSTMKGKTTTLAGKKGTKKGRTGLINKTNKAFLKK